MRQTKLNLYQGQRGGRRPGSGRKRLHSKGVAHREREQVSGRTPMHINFKYRTTIRNKTCLKLLARAIRNARSHGLRINHYSLQSNHIHLIVEAPDNEILTRGMRSLTITMAKGLKQGRVQLERYHLHILRSIREARNAIYYVLFNKQKHEKGICSTVDGYSSLLGMQNGMELIRNYAVLKKVSLTITRDFVIHMDYGRSFLLQAGIKTLSSSARRKRC